MSRLPPSHLTISGVNYPRVSPKARKALRKKAREDEALAQQQRDVVLADLSGSGVPVSISGSQPDPELVSKSAPVDKGPDADSTTES
ncbi:hypothetical protein KY290_013593 [Solanum tuberosum]|uniref:Integrase core domain containing protein n=1 Tax=Solanum tuberosum TaxID=4113 RepID=A0ABQ7VM46_SOLTU|nr:hypothetical protein KY289_013720 [Solanum tuberosum]KAH0717040.1 hypothetical protein KY285_013071 [Solanum tuberosum]KAH0769612.1 hypothetical protein KY290_013593 [Solanum tuberosum]